MIMRLSDRFRWHVRQLTPEVIFEKHQGLLLKDEVPELTFPFFRDALLFTGHRVIILGFRGLMGDQCRYVSLPYGSIVRFSVECTGNIERAVFLKIWAQGDTTASVEWRMHLEDAFKAQGHLLEKLVQVKDRKIDVPYLGSHK